MNSQQSFLELTSKQLSSTFTAIPSDINRGWKVLLAEGTAEITDTYGAIHTGTINKLSLNLLILSSVFGQLVYGLLNRSWDQWAFFEGTSETEPAGAWIALITRLHGVPYIGVIEETRPLIKGKVLAIPHGFIDPGEKGVEAALRELLEETGIQATNISSLGFLCHNTAFFGGSTTGAHSDEGFFVSVSYESQSIKFGSKESTLIWIPASEFVLSGFCAPSVAVTAKALFKITQESK